MQGTVCAACVRVDTLHRVAATDRCMYSSDFPGRAISTISLAFALTLSVFGSAQAQHASDNPVVSAEDAFGLTLGLESIGMYSPGQVRGFSPQAAGNVRIEGLYFDQQGALSNRVVEGSTIRVGISEVGYPFPAPTGIVDYQLRHAGDGTPGATVIATAGPYEARGVSVDGTMPLLGKELQLPVGAATQISTQTPYGNYPGYTSAITSVGAVPLWTPNDKVMVRAIFDWQETRNATTFPLFFTAGDFLPPRNPQGYLGQNWAEGRALTKNLGGLMTAQLSQHWSLAAGLFRSIADTPVSFADFYTGVQHNGAAAEHLLVGYPDQISSSTSGEIRLKGRLAVGDWHHDLILLARGRDILARYGGDDLVDVGPAAIGSGAQVPEPDFAYSARTVDRTQLWSAGLAYHVDWHNFLTGELGVQEEIYRKKVSTPGTPEFELTDRPARGYGNLALALTRALSLYGGYTQGLEDSGIAPSVATNRGAILPASLTWQGEAGVRYLLTSHLKVIAGVYELQKPYFNLDMNGVDRDLGVQRARGAEFSLAGQTLGNFDVNVGVLVAKVGIVGADLAADGIGPVAVGQPRLQYVANVNYRVPWWRRLSLDLAVTHFGTQPASVDNRLYTSAVTWLNVGARYKFVAMGKDSSLRIQVQNVPGSSWWTNVYTPGLFQWPAPRTVFAYLTADL
jgi:iron complex outermembrane recepter protein